MTVNQLFKNITTFIFDIDGILTDGTVLVLDGGVQARRMSIRDGFALQMAVNHGYKVLIVSGGNSPQVQDRLEKLGIIDIYMSILDKKEFIGSYIRENRLKAEQVLYMGDDLPDLAVMAIVGLPCCPADAVPEVKEVVKYVSPLAGGNACVRDVIEKVLRSNDHWNIDDEIASR